MWNKNKRVRDKAWKIPITSPAGKKPHILQKGRKGVATVKGKKQQQQQLKSMRTRKPKQPTSRREKSTVQNATQQKNAARTETIPLDSGRC